MGQRRDRNSSVFSAATSSSSISGAPTGSPRENERRLSATNPVVHHQREVRTIAAVRCFKAVVYTRIYSQRFCGTTLNDLKWSDIPALLDDYKFLARELARISAGASQP